LGEEVDTALVGLFKVYHKNLIEVNDVATIQCDLLAASEASIGFQKHCNQHSVAVISLL
jgi:hypothetical protein